MLSPADLRAFLDFLVHFLSLGERVEPAPSRRIRIFCICNVGFMAPDSKSLMASRSLHSIRSANSPSLILSTLRRILISSAVHLHDRHVISLRSGPAPAAGDVSAARATRRLHPSGSRPSVPVSLIVRGRGPVKTRRREASPTPSPDEVELKPFSDILWHSPKHRACEFAGTAVRWTIAYTCRLLMGLSRHSPDDRSTLLPRASTERTATSMLRATCLCSLRHSAPRTLRRTRPSNRRSAVRALAVLCSDRVWIRRIPFVRFRGSYRGAADREVPS